MTTVTLRRFRPTIGFSLFAFCGVLLLLGLGGWQLQRMAAKQALIAHITQQMQAAPIDALAIMPEAGALEPTLRHADYRRVTVSGEFLHDKEFHLAARDVKRSVYGYQILTPLRLFDGRLVLVSRGWVPPTKKEATTRAEAPVRGVETVTGILRRPKPRGWLVPDNSPDKNLWLWLDMVGMAKAGGLPEFAPFYVEAEASSNAGDFPVGGQTRVSFPDNHSTYALTWFCLALALVGVWLAKSWVKPEQEPDGAA